MAPTNQTYLGDGVYAAHDGYMVTLAVNHHLNHALSLEPEVFKALLEYVIQFPEYAAEIRHMIKVPT